MGFGDPGFVETTGETPGPESEPGKRYPSGVNLEGDEEGIAVLKGLHAKDKSYLKFLVGEAKSNTDMKTTFKGDDGCAFVLRLDPKSGNLIVEKQA